MYKTDVRSIAISKNLAGAVVDKKYNRDGEAAKEHSGWRQRSVDDYVVCR